MLYFTSHSKSRMKNLSIFTKNYELGMQNLPPRTPSNPLESWLNVLCFNAYLRHILRSGVIFYCIFRSFSQTWSTYVCILRHMLRAALAFSRVLSPYSKTRSCFLSSFTNHYELWIGNSAGKNQTNMFFIAICTGGKVKGFQTRR